MSAIIASPEHEGYQRMSIAMESNMPEFDLIKGRGDTKDFMHSAARQAFGKLTIDLLRSLTRGSADYKLIQGFMDFIEWVNAADVTLYEIMDSELRELHHKAFAYAVPGDRVSDEHKDIVEASTRLLADMLCKDGFAKARISKSEHELKKAVERNIQESERKSRGRGWSYVAGVTEGIPPIENKTASPKKRRSKDTKRYP